MKYPQLIAMSATVLMCSASSVSYAQDTSGGKHLFILSGQSNMSQLPLEVSFTPAMEKEFGKENVIIVKKARPGAPIRRYYKNWKPPEGQSYPVNKKSPNADVEAMRASQGGNYDRMMADVYARTEGVPVRTITFLWMQGEHDGTKGLAGSYAESLQGLMDQLYKDLGRNDLNVVIGRINDIHVGGNESWNKVREIQVQFAESHPRGAWVNTDDLNDHKDEHGRVENSMHYTPEGKKIFGQRLAGKAIALVKSHPAEHSAVIENPNANSAQPSSGDKAGKTGKGSKSTKKKASRGTKDAKTKVERENSGKGKGKAKGPDRS